MGRYALEMDGEDLYELRPESRYGDGREPQVMFLIPAGEESEESESESEDESEDEEEDEDEDEGGDEGGDKGEVGDKGKEKPTQSMGKGAEKPPIDIEFIDTFVRIAREKGLEIKE